MCRIFGFRSVIPSQVHQSLLSQDNALINQSGEHCDGWGVSYYVAGAPHVIKSDTMALGDTLFKKVSGVVSSETVIAHLRKATRGGVSLLNTHPFQYGKWVFAHNGNIAEFDRVKPELAAHIAPILRRFILGETDSELLFYLLLTHVSRYAELHRDGCGTTELIDAIGETIKQVTRITGPFSTDPPDENDLATYLTFVLTNGVSLVGHQGGRELHYSTHKTRCCQRDSCPSFDSVCEKPVTQGRVNHMIFSSEPLGGENVWIEMKPGQIIGVDWRMRLKITN